MKLKVADQCDCSLTFFVETLKFELSKRTMQTPQSPHARAWLLCADFIVAAHPRLADITLDQIFPAYISELIESRASYLNSRLSVINFISYTVPWTLSSLQDPGVVPIDAIFHGSRAVNQQTLEGLFSGVAGLTAKWGALHYGPGTASSSLEEHPMFQTFLRESSLGWNPASPAKKLRVDYRGTSEAVQPSIGRLEERSSAWRFEAKIDAAHQADLVHVRGEICSEYFHLNILSRISNWETIKKEWALISYSVKRNIIGEHGRDHAPVPVVGYFRRVSKDIHQ